MGDLRNKARKQEEEARIKAMRARLEAKPKGDPIRCQCGLTADQVPTMWAHQAGRWSGVEFYCSDCIPAVLLNVGTCR